MAERSVGAIQIHRLGRVQIPEKWNTKKSHPVVSAVLLKLTDYFIKIHRQMAQRHRSEKEGDVTPHGQRDLLGISSQKSLSSVDSQNYFSPTKLLHPIATLQFLVELTSILYNFSNFYTLFPHHSYGLASSCPALAFFTSLPSIFLRLLVRQECFY